MTGAARRSRPGVGDATRYTPSEEMYARRGCVGKHSSGVDMTQVINKQRRSTLVFVERRPESVPYAKSLSHRNRPSPDICQPLGWLLSEETRERCKLGPIDMSVVDAEPGV